MKKYYLIGIFALFITTITIFVSCSDSEEEQYIPVSPVSVNLTQVPYPKLSDYHFFEGNADQNTPFTAVMKDLNPSLDVLPYEPASVLFSDYAHKKRFVWMPKGTKATYDGDGKTLQFPVGAVLIKTFYYDDVQGFAAGTRRIIETRIMIKKATGWIFADYVWNAAQTEALLDNSGSFTQVNWLENGVPKTANYRIPSEEQCIVCHKKREIVNGVEITAYTPIGTKPQNLNFNRTYGTQSKNQLMKWIEQGYLENNFTLPTAANSTIDYSDTSKPLELRVRSYFDINCAHCHANDRHCDYRPMRFAFSETANNPANMGVCVETQDMQDFDPALSKIVNPGNINRSMLYHRINTTDEAYRMPLHGRTVIHTEGVQMIEQWINSLQPCN